MGYSFESDVWNNGARKHFSAILNDYFRNLMAPLAQNVGENLGIILTSMTEKNIIVPDNEVHHPQESQQAT